MNDSNFTFRGQRPDEEVRLVVRRHPIVFFWPLLQSTIALAFIVLALIFWGLSDIFYIVVTVLILIIFSLIFKISFIYSNSFCLVTNQRVINVDQRGFFNRVITETDYAKIQEVTNSTSGMIGTTFNIGEINILTAGKESQLTIRNIPDPYSIQQEITKNISTK
ncbi:MAG: PH domain-containing protein [Patescibacteria group bacterium]|jgi:membrane protein YdbS with pleckstrin-like domain|nr:PH domain-containing protein [Patescibacteria group bacterium]